MLTFTNQAALSYRNRVRYSNLTTGQIADALTVSKSALSGTYEADGDTISAATLSTRPPSTPSATGRIPCTTT